MADDIVGLSGFYADLLDLEEVVSLRSEHFRGLKIGDTILGFSSHHAYELLNLSPPHSRDGNVSFLTFELADDAAVDVMTDRAVAAGAKCVRSPNRTYYGAWQSVLLDPEGNAFRLNHLTID